MGHGRETRPTQLRFFAPVPTKNLPFSCICTLSLSLIIAGLSVGLKSLAEPFGTKIEQIENIPIDLLSQFQLSEDENIILLKLPQRVIGELNNPQILTSAIEEINKNAKPQVFIIDSELAKKYLPNNLSEPQWRLNHRIFDRLTPTTIESVLELSPAEIENKFNGKIVAVVERNSLINKYPTANKISLESSLNLIKIQSKAEEFIWIFMWCNLSVLTIWQIGTRLFVPITVAVVGSQIILGGLLLIMGNGVPIVITSIAIISAGIIIFKIDHDFLPQDQS